MPLEHSYKSRINVILDVEIGVITALFDLHLRRIFIYTLRLDFFDRLRQLQQVIHSSDGPSL